MGRGCAAAASDDIQKSGLCPFTDVDRHRVGIKIVLTKLVRKSRIRVRANIGVCYGRQLFDVLAQIVGAQGTVQADRQWLRMSERVPERLCCLSGERTSGRIGDCS